MVRFSELFKKKGSELTPTPPPPGLQKIDVIPFAPIKEKISEEKETIPRIRIVRVEKEVPPEIPPPEATNQKDISNAISPEIPQQIIEPTPAVKSETPKNDREVSFTQAMLNPSEGDRLIISPAGNTIDDGDASSSKEISLADIMRKEDDEKFQRANKIYQQLGDVVMSIFEEFHCNHGTSKIDYVNLLKPLDEGINLIITGNRTLLGMTYQYSDEEYIKLHLINVGIISLYVGYGMDYNKSRLTELGILALLHEVEAGIPVEFPDANDIEGLSRVSLFLLRKIQYLGETIIPAFKQKSTGSQRNIQVTGNITQAIVDYVKIISLADTYETLCRPKPYRKKMSPQLVIKQLIESGDDFDKNILKVLIKLIGLYPVGSWVELNTGEIARVISNNEISPLRPIVQITFDKDKRRQNNIKIFDLMSNQNIYVKAPISEDEIEGLS